MQRERNEKLTTVYHNCINVTIIVPLKSIIIFFFVVKWHSSAANQEYSTVQSWKNLQRQLQTKSFCSRCKSVIDRMKIFRVLFLALCILVSSVAGEEKDPNPLEKIGSAFNEIKGKILGRIKKLTEAGKKKTEEVAVETKEEIEEVVESVDDAVSEEPETNDESGETGEVEDDSTEETEEEL